MLSRPSSVLIGIVVLRVAFTESLRHKMIPGAACELCRLSDLSDTQLLAVSKLEGSGLEV